MRRRQPRRSRSRLPDPPKQRRVDLAAAFSLIDRPRSTLRGLIFKKLTSSSNHADLGLLTRENRMSILKRTLIALVPVIALGACTTLSDQDRAMLSSASQNAEQAKTMAQQALDAAHAAQASANT